MNDLRALKGNNFAILIGVGGFQSYDQHGPQCLGLFGEEACELVDAIESGDLEQVRDELGDLLLQVVFQAQIFSERGLFEFDDVAGSIAEKLLRRHPHVFDVKKTNACRQEIDKQWDIIKNNESSGSKSCLADHLPTKLPSLQYAQKLISKAHKSGHSTELPNDYQSLIELLPQSPELSVKDLDEKTVGQILFQVVNLARTVGVDAESALRKTTRELLHQLDGK